MHQNHDHIPINHNRILTDYTTVPCEMHQNYIHTQKNHNLDPPGTPSPLSGKII